MNLAQTRSLRRRLARAAAIIASALCASLCQADDAPGEDNAGRPNVVPAPGTGTPVGGAARQASFSKISSSKAHTPQYPGSCFPQLAEGVLPTTDFGVIVLPSFLSE